MSITSSSRWSALRRTVGWVFLVGGVLPGAVLLSCGGCASRRLIQREPPAQPFDAVVIPGCPTTPAGTLSPCQERRARWGAVLWHRGYTRHFITSGGAAYTPHPESEALAQALCALGVPAERIYLESESLHTDENMLNSLRLARRLGWQRLAVASDGWHATGSCQMLLSEWGQACRALPVDAAALREPGVPLSGQRTAPVAGWQPLPRREAARAQQAGRRRRPPSAVLYPFMRLMKALGRPWQPFTPTEIVVQTWADRQRALQGHP